MSENLEVENNKLIIHDNKKAQFVTNNQEEYKKLKKFLSFRAVGVEFTAAYKNGWNGITYLIDSKGYFLSGLVNKVIEFLNDNNIKFVLIDKSIKTITNNPSIDLTSKMKELGFEVRDYQARIAQAAISNSKGIIRACTGSGKCNAVDSLSITQYGLLDYNEIKQLLQIELKDNELAHTSLEVATPLRQNNKDVANALYYDGYSKSFKITTKYGYTLTATPDHKIKILNKKGDFVWKRFEDLEVDDYTAISYNNQMFGNNTMSLDEAYWYGLLIGDGGLPISIRSLRKEPLAMVIRGIYETDGWVENTKNAPSICLGLSNEKLIDQIQLILLNFGIICSRRLKRTYREDSHILTIYRDFIPQFLKEIGLDPKGHKLKKLNDAMSDCQNTISNGNTNIIPHQKFKIEELVNEYISTYSKKNFITECPIKYSTIRSWSGTKAWRHPSKHNLIKFVEWFKTKIINDKTLNTQTVENLLEKLNNLEYLCTQNLFFNPIKTKEETFSHNYDFHIPETHSFVSQGFINHNTLVTGLITAHFNKPTIIYVIGLDLLKQFHELYSKLFDEPIGFVGDGKCEIHRINIASIWTISSALKVKKPFLQDDEDLENEKAPSQIQSEQIIKMLKDTKLHIFDESHVVTTDTIKHIFNKINPENIYGFSGTPFRDDGSDLLINSILGEQIINVSASELIEKQFLAQPIIKFIKVPKMSTGSTYPSVYKDYVVDNIIRNNLIVEQTKELLDKKYQVLVLFKTLQHGKQLKELFDQQQIEYEYLSGKDSLEARMKTKEILLSKTKNLVLASSIFDIGVDIPSLSALVLAGGGKSSIRALQRIGRVIRKYPGKKIAAIVDFYDDVRYLKAHSKKRYQIYKFEKGFKIIVPKNINDLK